MQKKYLNKKVAPLIVSLCLIGYYIVVIFSLVKISIPFIIKMVISIISIILTFVVIKVLIERIKEINGGEEDDLGKY